MRDGARLKADVFRPKAGGRFPVIINLGAYQKDKLWVPPADLEEAPNPHMNWETVNPLWWMPRGYAAVRVDTRGSGKSPGRTDPWSPSEATDFYDAIEWAGRQAWSSGRVGTSGVSYFAMTQWLVAGLKPPSLKAMIPWEGAADMYRDFGYHGGIFSFGFVVNWYNNHMAHHLLGKPQASAPDAFSTPWVWEYMRYSLDAEWWHGRRADWERIDIPFLSAGNWSGMGLHLRGNTEAFVRARSTHKRLRIHAGTHYHPFYTQEARREQLEVTGPLVLVLWVASSTEDMDIFATLRNIAPDGADVFEKGQQGQPVPVAKGWLRASHRALDADLSLPYRPYHAHARREWLKPGEPVRVEVEIWPTSMVFARGHRLRLDV